MMGVDQYYDNLRRTFGAGTNVQGLISALIANDREDGDPFILSKGFAPIDPLPFPSDDAAFARHIEIYRKG